MAEPSTKRRKTGPQSATGSADQALETWLKKTAMLTKMTSSGAEYMREIMHENKWFQRAPGDYDFAREVALRGGVDEVADKYAAELIRKKHGVEMQGSLFAGPAKARILGPMIKAIEAEAEEAHQQWTYGINAAVGWAMSQKRLRTCPEYNFLDRVRAKLEPLITQEVVDELWEELKVRDFLFRGARGYGGIGWYNKETIIGEYLFTNQPIACPNGPPSNGTPGVSIASLLPRHWGFLTSMDRNHQHSFVIRVWGELPIHVPSSFDRDMETLKLGKAYERLRKQLVCTMEQMLETKKMAGGPHYDLESLEDSIADALCTLPSK